MLEEDLYFAFILCVWRPDDVFSRLRGVIFADYSGVMQLVLGRIVRKKTLRDLEGQVRPAERARPSQTQILLAGRRLTAAFASSITSCLVTIRRRHCGEQLCVAVHRSARRDQCMWMSTRSLCAQGIGRHSMEYVRERMFEELSACAALLDASGAFLIGGAPAIADCFLFAIIDMVRSGRRHTCGVRVMNFTLR